ncbi:hypothetical protein BE17_39845 [Sorangium cellulosum]|uniref:Uncharacterized protein n=1 Tax=Sorangium cellulosum TaxID=56 RepID=A0A150RA85_SORCE|nr:hypothetical protein BE17_39845 [Sorangium cellulosum]
MTLDSVALAELACDAVQRHGSPDGTVLPQTDGPAVALDAIQQSAGYLKRRHSRLAYMSPIEFELKTYVTALAA